MTYIIHVMKTTNITKQVSIPQGYFSEITMHHLRLPFASTSRWLLRSIKAMLACSCCCLSSPLLWNISVSYRWLTTITRPFICPFTFHYISPFSLSSCSPMASALLISSLFVSPLSSAMFDKGPHVSLF